MRFREYQKKAYRAIPDHESEKEEVLHWLTGLCEESGEVASLIKHHYWGGEPLRKEELTKELGDVLWYLSALATTLSVDLDDIARDNINKLLVRFPDNFDTERSKIRHELDTAANSN